MKPKAEPLFRFFSRCIASTFRPFGKHRQAMAQAIVADHLVPIWTQKIGDKGALRFWAPSYRPLFRGWSILSKEPDTIAWIDGFEKASLFWDVGANIGVYSLYAAISTAQKVIAFEPLASNYHVLNRNIQENQLGSRITAYCMALSPRSQIDYLNIQANEIGSSHHQFAAPRNDRGETFNPIFRQGTIGYSIDDLVADHGFEVPNYIKIDVDGIESKILEGAQKTLENQRLRSLMIEVQTNSEYERIYTLLQRSGFQETGSRKQNYRFDREHRLDL